MSVQTAPSRARNPQVTDHCLALVRLTEEVILSRAPKFFRPKSLTCSERQAFAEHLAAALQLLVDGPEVW